MILNLPKLGVCTWVIIVLSFKTSTTTAFSAIDLNARRNYDNAIFVNPSSSTPMKNEWFITPETTTTTATRRRRRRRKHSTLLRMSKESSSVSSMPKFTQVISDVDDTLKSSGGVNVAGVALGGIDVQYERGDFYPGVAQFMLELSLQNSHGEQVVTPPKVAILTARAEEFKLALELKDSSKLAVAFRTAGERAGIQSWGLGPVLYGSVAEWVIQDRKGLRKFNNFERLLEQDPTGSILQYVYVGDTGELDQEAGETMLREYPELVKAVFLHVVSDEPNPPIPAPKVINGRPILFFRTYVGAATMATELGLMSGEALTRVIKSAEAKLKDVPRTTDKWVDLEKDIAKAIRTLNIQLV